MYVLVSLLLCGLCELVIAATAGTVSVKESVHADSVSVVKH